MGSRLGRPNKPTLITWRGTDKDPALFIARVMMDDSAPLPERLKAAVALLPHVWRKLPTEVEVEQSLIYDRIERVVINGQLADTDG